MTGLWKSPRNRRTGRRKSPTCHTHHGDGTWGPASRAAQAGSKGPSAPAFVLSACTLPEVNHAFFTFAEGDLFGFLSLLLGCDRGAKPRGRDAFSVSSGESASGRETLLVFEEGRGAPLDRLGAGGDPAYSLGLLFHSPTVCWWPVPWRGRHGGTG